MFWWEMPVVTPVFKGVLKFCAVHFFQFSLLFLKVTTATIKMLLPNSNWTLNTKKRLTEEKKNHSQTVHHLHFPCPCFLWPCFSARPPSLPSFSLSSYGSGDFATLPSVCEGFSAWSMGNKIIKTITVFIICDWEKGLWKLKHMWSHSGLPVWYTHTEDGVVLGCALTPCFILSKQAFYLIK